MSAEAKEPGGLVPGRIVHYYPRREDIRRAGRLVNADRFVCPAMVTQVLGTPIQLVDLTVFGLGTPFEVAGVPYDESGRVDGAWHWMFEGQENRRRPEKPSETPRPGPGGLSSNTTSALLSLEDVVRHYFGPGRALYIRKENPLRAEIPLVEIEEARHALLVVEMERNRLDENKA